MAVIVYNTHLEVDVYNISVKVPVQDTSVAVIVYKQVPMQRITIPVQKYLKKSQYHFVQQSFTLACCSNFLQYHFLVQCHGISLRYLFLLTFYVSNARSLCYLRYQFINKSSQYKCFSCKVNVTKVVEVFAISGRQQMFTIPVWYQNIYDEIGGIVCLSRGL